MLLSVDENHMAIGFVEKGYLYISVAHVFHRKNLINEEERNFKYNKLKLKNTTDEKIIYSEFQKFVAANII